MIYFDLEDRVIGFLKWIEFIFDKNNCQQNIDNKQQLYVYLEISMLIILKINSFTKKISIAIDKIINKYVQDMNVCLAYSFETNNFYDTTRSYSEFYHHYLDYISVIPLFRETEITEHHNIHQFNSLMPNINNYHNLDYVTQNIDNIPELLNIVNSYTLKYQNYIFTKQLYKFNFNFEGYYYILDYFNERDIDTIFITTKDDYNLNLSIIINIILTENMFGCIEPNKKYKSLLTKMVDYLDKYYQYIDGTCLSIYSILVFKIYNINCDIVEEFQKKMLKQQDNNLEKDYYLQHSFSIQENPKDMEELQHTVCLSSIVMIILTFKSGEMDTINQFLGEQLKTVIVD